MQHLEENLNSPAKTRPLPMAASLLAERDGAIQKTVMQLERHNRIVTVANVRVRVRKQVDRANLIF
jgi:hypothetical protein